MLKRNLVNNKDGLVLIISLWILAIISLLCLSLAHRVMINIKLVKFQRDRMKSLYIAKAGIQEAMNVLKGDSTPGTDVLNELWSRGYDEEAEGDGYIFKEVELGDGVFTVSYVFDDSDSESPAYLYGMSDEDRKININEADSELLESLFDLIGASDPESLAENIIYWRGDASEGVKDSYYEGSQIPYPPRKAPLKSIEELSLVKGFREDPELVKECERYFTVYTSDNSININTTYQEILKSVFVGLGADDVNPGLSDRLVSSVIDFRDGSDNEEATDDDVVIISNGIKEILKKDLVEPTEIDWVDNQAFPFTDNSNLFRIEVLAGLNTGKVQKKVTVVIDRSEEPFKVTYWNEE